MIGVSADQFTGDNSGVIIGEESTRNNTYFNGKITDIRKETTISGTTENIIQPNIDVDTDFVDVSRDVSNIIVDFTSNTPYAPTHYILLDPSEAILGDVPFGSSKIDDTSTLIYQSDGGTGLDLRISRLSKSRRIIVTIPPACASRFTITLYDDDNFTSVSGGYGISDERRGVMETNMNAFHFSLTGSNLRMVICIVFVIVFKYHPRVHQQSISVFWESIVDKNLMWQISYFLIHLPHTQVVSQDFNIRIIQLIQIDKFGMVGQCIIL